MSYHRIQNPSQERCVAQFSMEDYQYCDLQLGDRYPLYVAFLQSAEPFLTFT